MKLSDITHNPFVIKNFGLTEWGSSSIKKKKRNIITIFRVSPKAKMGI